MILSRFKKPCEQYVNNYMIELINHYDILNKIVMRRCKLSDSIYILY